MVIMVRGWYYVRLGNVIHGAWPDQAGLASWLRGQLEVVQ
jgi:hypothetical protein